MLRSCHWCPPSLQRSPPAHRDTLTHLVRRLLVVRDARTQPSIQIFPENPIEIQPHFRTMLPPLSSSKRHRMRNAGRKRTSRAPPADGAASPPSAVLPHLFVIR